MGKKDTEIGADIGITADVKDAVTNINKLGSSLSRIDSQLKDILTHFDNLNKMSLDNVTPKHFVHSSKGSMSSESGREKTFKEYQNTVIEETKAIKEDVKERTRLRERNTKAVEERIKNERERIRKAEDRDSEAFKAERKMKVEAQYLNAKNRAAGALLKNPRYQTGKAFENIGQKIEGIGVGSDKLEGKLLGGALSVIGTTLKSPFAGAAASITHLANSVIDLGKAAVTAYAEIESIRTQLGVVFSNQTQADSMFNEISAYAVKSPFGVQQTSELAVLLKQSGVYASDLMDTLKMIGDTAGGNVEKMKRIANNYAQIVSIGKASMLDMRQFAYAGIPIFEAVSKELGVSQQELRKLISDGKVTSDIIEKVFKDLTGINGIFENATEKGAKTLKARLQNLSDAKQLAYSSLGDYVTNAGSKTGNDSYIYKLVSNMEDFYSEMKTNLDLRDLKNDVKTIANRDNEIRRLEYLIEYNKEQGNNTKALEKLLELEKNKSDPDAERATYENLFKLIIGDRYTKEQVEDNLSSVLSNIGLLTENKNYYSEKYLKEKAATDVKNRNQPFLFSPEWFSMWKVLDDDNLMQLPVETLESMSAETKELLSLIKNSKSITTELIRAIRESSTINAQQLAFDTTNSRAKSSNSLTNSFQELASAVKNSDEYQKKEEEKKQTTLKSALKELKAIASNVDSNGILDVSKYSDEQLLDLQKRGAFTSGRKLNFNDEDRNLLESQVLSRALDPNFIADLRKNANGNQYAGKLIDDYVNSLQSLQFMNDKDFYDNFEFTYNLAIDNLTTMGESFQGLSSVINKKKKALNISLNENNVDTLGVNATEAMLQSSKQQFIPLWKRILSQYTGLTTNGMTDTLSTMKNYRDDMAIRNMTGDVLKAAMKTNGVDSAMSLIRTNRSIQLAGDNGKTFQVDWGETKKAIHDFATQLSSSTEVISAYKKGLEEELNVYEELVAAGYTQAESTDLGSQKFVTSKQLEKLGLGNQSQLVNAFGEYLETESGKRYSTSEVSYKDGQFFDKLGNPIQENVKVTGNLFEFIEKELPKIYEELREANATEVNNKYLADLVNKTAPSSLVSQLLSLKGVTGTTQFLASNPSLIENSLESGRKALLKDKKFKSLKKYSISDIQGFITDEDIDDNLKDTSREFMSKLFDTIIENTNKLLGSNQYINLTRLYSTIDRDNALNAELIKLNEHSGNIKPSKEGLKPEEYSGGRGFRNYLLKYSMGSLLGERSYDMEDLYLRAARTENIEGSDKNQYGIDSTKYKNKSDEEILDAVNGLDAQEKAWIRINEAQTQSLETLHEYANSMTAILGEFAMNSWQKPFEKMGENLALGQNALEGMDEVYKNLSVELVKASGEAMVKAGWELVARGAASNSKSMIAGGLGLVAAGGFASGLGSALLNNDSDDDSDDDTEKLSKLKDQLADLLKQAREDAIYYENTLRHKKALSANSELTVKSVHDAVITPRGDVVTTDPKDYLIATKTPRTLVGGGAPSINFNVIDKSTGIKVTQQKSTYNAQTNTVDFEAIIESKVSEFIATSKGDDAFAARQSRLNGKSVIA